MLNYYYSSSTTHDNYDMPHHVTGEVDTHRRQCATSMRHNDSDDRAVPHQSRHTTTTMCHVEDNDTWSRQCAMSRTMTHEVDNMPHQPWQGTTITGLCHVNDNSHRQLGTTTMGYLDGDRAQRQREPAWDAFASWAFGKFFYIHFLLCFFALIILKWR